MENLNPLVGLLIGAGIFIILSIVYWPKKGIVARWRAAKKNTERVLIEDSLKHLYNCEYDSITCDLNSLAGSLNISPDKAAQLISKLIEFGLISSKEDKLNLTSAGREYALKIIRIHRLWEKYLADETSVGEEDWHLNAEEVEHNMTLAEADELAAKIGNPVYDPHGDPIPTAKGDLPVKKGVSLSQLKEGEFAHIIHIEDEPNYIYSQIVAAGLYPGIQIKLLESTPERIKFLANGEEVVLAPLFAQNITVAPIKGEPQIEGKFKKLSELKVGEKGLVLGISRKCRGQQRRRLMDLGVVPGSEIEVEMKNISGDPVAYRIKGATIALRKKQADKIYMENDKDKT